MKINAISQINNNKNLYQKNKSGNKHIYNEDSDCGLISYPANYYLTSFKGINLEKMYDEYNWYINHDNVPAIKSFLKMTAPKEDMKEFLEQILQTKDRSYELIDSIVSIPRESCKIYDSITEKTGVQLMPFWVGSNYNTAYTQYINQKYKNANTLSELLKIRPDWSEDALIKKYITLAGNDKLKIGNIPKQIPKEHLDIIIPYLKSKIDVGIKQRKNIDDLVINGRTYKFLYYTEGRSSKSVFGVTVPAADKKYVIKMDRPENRSLDAPFALGTLAKIDKYLTANRSRNSAPLCYYDHDQNFSIYKYIEHSHIEGGSDNLNVIKKHLPDFRALGLEYNDTVGYKNFFKLNENSLDTHWRMEGYNEALNNNEWISVDNDHVTYNNKLQPSITGYHKALPNAMQVCV